MIDNVLEYLEATASRTPNRTAIIDRDGSITFGELVTQSRALAGRIAARTSAKNEPIAVYLERSRDCIVAFAAILFTGNCYAPLDVKSPDHRTAKIIENLQPKLIITNNT